MTGVRTVVGLVAVVVLVSLGLLSQRSDAATSAQWTTWSKITTRCSEVCGIHGTQKQVRTCSKPTPADDGALCLIEGTEVRARHQFRTMKCNLQSCFEEKWTDWQNCTAECDIGKEFKYAMCGNIQCKGPLAKVKTQECNTWNKTTCPSPCIEMNENKKCPDYAVCRDLSTEKKPNGTCVCTMGYLMTKDKKSCIRPPPTTPTPRPIPTLEPAVKVVATVVSKTASTVLIVCVSICLAIFLILRIFTPDRIIQMNMEIALLLAHVLLIFPPEVTEIEVLCRAVSIFIHYFFTACFMFMFLEALHMYGYVASVIKQDGMFSKAQNMIAGWGISAIVILFCMCFEYDNYGASYHCWLRMDTPLLFGQLMPIIFLTILTFTIIEAAGAADYKAIGGMDNDQLTSARVSQRTNLVILPLVFSHMLVGMFSEYEQNIYLYSIFTILNAVTGLAVLFLHCANNQKVRMKMKAMYEKTCKGKRPKALKRKR